MLPSCSSRVPYAKSKADTRWPIIVGTSGRASASISRVADMVQ